MTRFTKLIGLCAVALLISPVSAQTDTTFSYQGSLMEFGDPAIGTYSMDFSLWDALSGGSQIGSTLNVAAQSVNEGLFDVALDFGADTLSENILWLEITVDGNTLAPRQRIAATPFSIQTRGFFVDDTNRVGVNMNTPSAQTQMHVRSTTGDNFGILVDSFGVLGTELGLHTGTANYAGLAKNTFFAPGWKRFSDTNGAFLQEIDPDGNVSFMVGPPGTGFIDWKTGMMISSANGYIGIGTSTPNYPIHIETTGYGLVSLSTNNGSRAVLGVASSNSGLDTIGVEGRTNSVSGIGVRGEGSSSSGVNYGVYGVSNSPDGFDFLAAGVGANYGATSSRRWKSNIKNIDHPLDKIAQLRGVYFDWDQDHGGQHDMGMIAEEVGKVLPEIVNYEENGIDAVGMDYSKLTPLLIEATNALRVEKDAQLAQRDEQISQLNQRITLLEQMIVQINIELSRSSK